MSRWPGAKLSIPLLCVTKVERSLTVDYQVCLQSLGALSGIMLSGGPAVSVCSSNQSQCLRFGCPKGKGSFYIA